MSNLQSMLTGNRVYRMSSHAPNRGQVNATGYIQRGIRQQNQGVSQWGSDGQSDTRSGIAAAALRARAAQSSQTAYMNQGTQPNPGSWPGQANPQQPQPSQQNTLMQPKQGALTTNPFVAPSMAPTAKVQTTATGAIKLPYSFTNRLGIVSQRSKLGDTLAGLEKQRQADILSYLENSKGEADKYGQQARDLLDSYASRGLATSTGYGSASDQNMADYQDVMSKLLEGATRSANTHQSERARAISNYNRYVQAQAIQQGYNIIKKAGTVTLKKKSSSKKKKK